MNDWSSYDDDEIRATTVRASKGGGAGKWLIGGLAVVVLAGAGYFAWKNNTLAQPDTQTAYNDAYATEAVHAGPLANDQSTAPSNATAENTATDESATAPSSAAPRSSAPARRSARAATPLVPEAIIGITPASATAESIADENIIVNAPPRPVWRRTPTARRLAALYPVTAEEQGREGEAQLHCTIVENGALDCVRVSETRGFGNAALRVARTFRHAPQLADGRDATGTPVNLRVLFRLPPEARRG